MRKVDGTSGWLDEGKGSLLMRAQKINKVRLNERKKNVKVLSWLLSWLNLMNAIYVKALLQIKL